MAGNTIINDESVPLPGFISPVAMKGHSLDYGYLQINEGQWSNVGQLIRTSQQAKLIYNFQMLTRGIWSNPTGMGWTPANANPFNSGAAFKDFGIFEDFIGNQTLLFQVGDQVYSYFMADCNSNASTTTVIFQGIGTTLDTDFIGASCYINELAEAQTVSGCSVSAANNGIYTLTVGTAYSSAPTVGNTLAIIVPYNAPLTSLSTSLVNLPCMKSFVDNTGDAAPITIYTNGDIQPVQITGIQADDVSNLGFIGTGGYTSTNPNGGQFGASYPISTYGVGTFSANYPVTASGSPYYCCLGPDGNIWYTDYANSKIGKITPLGGVTEYATTTSNAKPYGICAGPDGRLWVTYYNADLIAAFTTAGVCSEYESLEGVVANSGICTDGFYIYNIAVGEGYIGQYIPSTGVLNARETTDVAAGSNLVQGPDIRLWWGGGDAAVYACEFGTGVTEYNEALKSFSVVMGVTVGPDDRIWFCDSGTNSIGAVTTSGTMTLYPVPTPASGVTAICSDGTDLWFTEKSANKIGRCTTSGVITEFVGLPSGAEPTGLAIGADGNLWICESNSGAPAIGVLLLDTANPRGCCTGPDNRIWFCEYATNKISAITIDGVMTEYILPNKLSGPMGICSDGTDLWFTEYGGNRIGRITTAGVITEYTTGLSSGANPVDICYGPDSNIWFCESGTSKVGKITSGGTITEYATTTSDAVPWGICSDGTDLWVCESAVSKIAKVTTSGTFTETATPTSSAQPYYIAYDGVSNVWFTENAVSQIGTTPVASVSIVEYLLPTSNAQPESICLGSDGNMYFAEGAANQLGRIATANGIIAGGTEPSLGTVTEWEVPANNAEPFGICNGPDQSIWYTMNGASEIGNFLYGGSETWPGVFQLTKKTYSKPKYNCYFNNRAVYFGFDPTTNAAVDVLISNQGSAGSFVTSAPIQATDAVTFTVPGLGLPTGCTAFRLANTNNQEILILGFQRGIAVVAGNSSSSDATTYELTILTREYGLMSNRSFTQIQNDMFFFSTNGWRSFSNLSINANLLNAAWTYQMQDVVQGITTTPIAGSNVLYNSQAFAVSYPDTLEIQYWYPASVDGSNNADFQNQHAIILNYNTSLSPPTGAPQQISPVFSTKGGTSVACGINFKGTFYGGGYDGLLQQHYSGNTYNGNAIAGELGFSLIAGPNIQQNIQLRQGIVVCESENTQNFQLGVYFFTKQNDGTLIRQLSPEGLQVITVGEEGETILGPATPAEWQLSISSFPNPDLKHAYFFATGEGPYIDISILTNGVDQVLDIGGISYVTTVGSLTP